MLLIWIISLWSFCVTNYLFMILFQNCYRYGCRCQYQNQRPILKHTRTTYFHIRPTTRNHFSETDGSLYTCKMHLVQNLPLSVCLIQCWSCSIPCPSQGPLTESPQRHWVTLDVTEQWSLHELMSDNTWNTRLTVT